ncbi:MAG: DUF2555 domain-containing protein [Synechococcaceae cyanobacterium RM1_1_27]|nr:DUF2555 domain-containing protein [Synechococcaceae cyanobacterium SM2_3_2]NJO86214.1 DUF2555 domain-containing protein [Synechococcaceae cyanobacterium RM1_1_27]
MSALSPSVDISVDRSIGLAPTPEHFSAADVAALAERLERNEYKTVFEPLEDWHTLRAVAFHSPELVTPYRHLLELEIDED